MTRPKWLLLLAAAAFLGWMAYLGSAVAVHRLAPPDVVSRSQLTAAGYVAVVEVTADGAAPAATVTVVHRLAGDGPEAGAAVTVANLPQATTPANAPLALPGRYLLALEPDGPGTFRIAGWPQGLGEGEVRPGVELKDAVKETDADGQTRTVWKSFEPKRFVRPPLAHPWTDAVKAQMTALGYKW